MRSRADSALAATSTAPSSLPVISDSTSAPAIEAVSVKHGGQRPRRAPLPVLGQDVSPRGRGRRRRWRALLPVLGQVAARRLRRRVVTAPEQRRRVVAGRQQVDALGGGHRLPVHRRHAHLDVHVLVALPGLLLLLLLPGQQPRRPRPEAAGRQRVVSVVPAAASPRRRRAAAGVPRLRVQGRPGPAVAHAPRALPPAEPLRGAPGPGGARGRADGAGAAGGQQHRLPSRRQRGSDPPRQHGHLPRADHGGQHAARLRRAPPSQPRLGLVHQPLRLRLPAHDPGRYPARILDAAAERQLHRAHRLPGLEGARAREATDRGPGALLLQEAGHLLRGADPAGDADGVQALHGVGVGGSVARLRRVRGVGVGQPAPDPAHVLLQLHLLPGGVLPDGGLQRAPLRAHRRQPRPPPHPVGRAAAPAPARAQPQRHGPHGAQRRALRPQVPARRPRARRHRRRAAGRARQERHGGGDVRAGRVVRRERGLRWACRCGRRRRRLGAQAGARRGEAAEARGQDRQVRGVPQQPVQVASR